MNIKGLIEAVTKESQNVLAEVSEDSVARFVQALDGARSIFCAAHGRSGYVLRCFCMRLMHLGYRAFFAGDTITPGITDKDVLVVCSGSGHTTLTYQWVQLGRQYGAFTCGLVGVQDSPIARALHCSVYLPGGSKRNRAKAGLSIQPPGSLFEQAAFVLFEAMVLGLYQNLGSDGHALLERHANLE